MQQSGLFEAVAPPDKRFSHAFVLGGNVDEFLESDLSDGWQADLSLNVFLVNEQENDVTKKILFQKSYHVSKPCRQKNPQALAEAMSAAMSEASVQIINEIYDHLADRQ